MISRKTRDFDQTLAAIARQKDEYASTVNSISDADLRVEIVPFD